MKAILIFIATFICLLLKDVNNVRAAALKCPENKSIVDLEDYKIVADNSTEEFDLTNREENKNSLNKLFKNIQCTLEKAKPWVAELHQEAKRLEEAAKLLGLGIINSFGEFVDKLVEETSEISTNTENFKKVNKEENASNSTEIVNEEISQHLCPDGFAADHNGVCVNESIK